MSAGDPSTRREALAIGAIAAGVLGLVVVPPLVRRLGPHPSESTCRALLERYGELTARALGETLDAAGREGAEAALREQALQPESIERCVRTMSAEAATCAMNAPTADELERCLQ